MLQLRVGRFYVQLASESAPTRVLAIIRDYRRSDQVVFVAVIDPIDPPSLYAAVGQVESGEFFGPSRRFNMNGAPMRVRIPKRADDPQSAFALWQASELLTGVTFGLQSRPPGREAPVRVNTDRPRRRKFQRARKPEEKEVRRQAILRAARAMLDEVTTSELSLNELARRSGVSKPNVYRYFESREEVLLQVWIEEVRELGEQLDASAPRRRGSRASGQL